MTSPRVDVIFAFDSEDHETPASDEGELWWADSLRRHRLTGCFNLVGEEARALRDRGRRDVLDALSRHEIGYHSNLHSAHPVHAEYLEGMGWDEGVAAVLAREAQGIADVRELTGQQPAAYCKPGENWAPQAPAAMVLLGIPSFNDAPFEWAPGQPMWYCGSLCSGYHLGFDRYFDVADRRRRMRQDFLALLDERRRMGGLLVMYTHPCRLVTSAFPDNFTAGRNPPRSAWRPAPLRPRREVEELMADFDDYLGWVAGDTDARITTYRALYDRYQRRNLWLDGAGVTQLLDASHAVGSFVGSSEGAIEPRRIGGAWLSPAEQLGALLWTAAWRREHDALPSIVPVRLLLGPDCLAAPTELGEIDATLLLERAAEASYQAGRSGRIPALVRIGDRLLGPGALLRALTQALVSGAERISVTPGDELPSLARRPDFANLHFQKTWSIFAPEFEAPGIIQLAQLQTWSARPAG